MVEMVAEMVVVVIVVVVVVVVRGRQPQQDSLSLSLRNTDGGFGGLYTCAGSGLPTINSPCTLLSREGWMCHQ